MQVFVTGGTGLVGRRLLPQLREQGHDVFVLSRQTNPQLPAGCTPLSGDPAVAGPWLERLASCDAVVHLAGENVFAHRWSKCFKRHLYNSRVDSTRIIAETLARQPLRADGSPKILISASAVGYYGFHDREELDEQSPPGNDFLATICRDWEKAAIPASSAGVRVANLRIGMVLAEEGGALKKLARPFRWFVGGPVAGGKQWVSWIHVADLVSLILFVLNHPTASGPFNATAPEPLTNWGFCKTLGKVLRRPSWLNVPGIAVRILLGQVAEVVRKGQRVLPQRTEKLGYSFLFPELETALRDLLERPADPSSLG